MQAQKMLKALKNMVIHLFPEFGDRTHLAMKAKVIAVHGDAGTPAHTIGQRFYSVDVQPLKPTGEVDKTKDILKDVPLDVPFSGKHTRGFFALPSIDTIVRVCFYDGNASFPYIDGIVLEKNTAPTVLPTEVLLQYRDGTLLRFTDEGHLDITLSEFKRDGIEYGSNMNIQQNAPLADKPAANFEHQQNDILAGANHTENQTAKEGGANRNLSQTDNKAGANYTKNQTAKEGGANHTTSQNDTLAGANRTETQNAVAGGANRTITLSDAASGANLNINLSAPGGGKFNLTCTGDIHLTSSKGNVNIVSSTGIVNLGGMGGKPVARKGDGVGNGQITSGSSKVLAVD